MQQANGQNGSRPSARHFRDRDQPPVQSPTAADEPWSSPSRPAQALSAEAATAPEDERIAAYAAEVQRGQRWLRFTPAIETQFQLDTSRQRFTYLFACLVIGGISLWIGIANEKNVIPATVAQVMPWWIGLMSLLVASCVGVAWVGHETMSRGWRMDKLAAIDGVLLACGIVLATNSSPVLTATVHASNVLLVLMWFSILSRLRFRISLTATLLTLAMYVVLAKAPSPVQQLIFMSNVKIMVFTTFFALTVNYMLEYRERRTYLLRKLDGLQSEALARAREALRHLSMQDALTGLHNRRQFEADFDIAWSKARFARQPVGLLMLDVDCFKLFNDTYGHPAGDACLKLVAEVLVAVAEQEGGSAARIGGEEFVLLLPGQNLDGVQRAGLAVCDGLRSAALAHRASRVAPHVTVSVGGVSAQAVDHANIGTARQALIKEADAALYEAKQAGRNRVLVRSVTLLATSPDPTEAVQTAEVEATSTAKDAVPVSLGDRAADSIAELTQHIKGRFYSLRFNPALEAQYQSEQVALRYKYLLASGLLGNVVLNGYWHFNFQMIADVADWFRPLLWALCAVIFAGLALIASPIKPWWRECVYALGVTASAVLTTLGYAHSQLASAYAGYLAVFLIPMFGCVAARQPFRYAMIPSLISLGTFAVFVSPVTPIEKVMTWDVTMMLLTATFFILMASYTMDHGERMDYLLDRLGVRQREALKATVASLHKLSSTDPLTGISNRRHFEMEFTVAWASSPGQAISLLILDVDHFKLYNDGHGHPAGDACLQQVASLVQRVAERAGCNVARLGGEEFGLLMPGCDADQALRIGQQVCGAVNAAGLPHLHSKVASNVTVSVGVATLVVGEDGSPRALMAMADEALYRAKTSGRNRALAWGKDLGESPPEAVQAASG